MNGTSSTEIAGLVSSLLNHYWTADDLVASRKQQIRDWLEDLIEFPVAVVAKACREWRQQPGGRRPTPGDIRALCIPEHNRLLAIEAKNRAQDGGTWEDWLYELWGPASTGRIERQRAIERQEAAYRRGEDWRRAQFTVNVADGFRTVNMAAAEGVSASEAKGSQKPGEAATAREDDFGYPDMKNPPEAIPAASYASAEPVGDDGPWWERD